MALVLAATGLFLYVRLRADLGHALERGLRSRAGDVSALVSQSDTGLKDAAHVARARWGLTWPRFSAQAGRCLTPPRGWTADRC